MAAKTVSFAPKIPATNVPAEVTAYLNTQSATQKASPGDWNEVRSAINDHAPRIDDLLARVAVLEGAPAPDPVKFHLFTMGDSLQTRYTGTGGPSAYPSVHERLVAHYGDQLLSNLSVAVAGTQVGGDIRTVQLPAVLAAIEALPTDEVKIVHFNGGINDISTPSPRSVEAIVADIVYITQQLKSTGAIVAYEDIATTRGVVDSAKWNQQDVTSDAVNVDVKAKAFGALPLDILVDFGSFPETGVGAPGLNAEWYPDGTHGADVIRVFRAGKIILGIDARLSGQEDVVISGSYQYVPPVPQAAAPSGFIMDDTANTADFTSFGTNGNTLADIEYTLDGGTTVAQLTARPLSVGTGARAAGAVRFRTKAIAGVRLASPWLSSPSAYMADVIGGEYAFTPQQLLYGPSLLTYAQVASADGSPPRAGQRFALGDISVSAPDGTYSFNRVELDHLGDPSCPEVVNVWAVPQGQTEAVIISTMSQSLRRSSDDWGAKTGWDCTPGTYVGKPRLQSTVAGQPFYVFGLTFKTV